MNEKQKSCLHDFSGEPCWLAGCTGKKCVQCWTCSVVGGGWIKDKPPDFELPAVNSGGVELTDAPEEKFPQPEYVRFKDVLKIEDVQKFKENMINSSVPFKTGWKLGLKKKKIFSYDTTGSVHEQKTGHKFNYGFSNSIKTGNSTVLDRIKELIRCGQRVVNEAEAGKTPCNESLNELDKALFNLREDGV